VQHAPRVPSGGEQKRPGSDAGTDDSPCVFVSKWNGSGFADGTNKKAFSQAFPGDAGKPYGGYPLSCGR
jgi:hypothetical protein